MHKAKKIQDNDHLYNFLRYYVDFVLHLSYRNVRYVGREKVPQDGAVIYAVNHTNALMDALVLLAMDRRPKVFVARADIFRNPKLAKILTWLKIMPIMRIRDGYDEVKKNNETFEKAVDVLRDKIPFCIFPEGTHQAKYSSLPLSKGIFRIAFQAQEMMPDMPLYIVPVGLRYGNFFRFRSTVRVQIGDPINVGEFIASRSDQTTAEQMVDMKDVLTERMKNTSSTSLMTRTTTLHTRFAPPLLRVRCAVWAQCRLADNIRLTCTLRQTISLYDKSQSFSRTTPIGQRALWNLEIQPL